MPYGTRVREFGSVGLEQALGTLQQQVAFVRDFRAVQVWPEAARELIVVAGLPVRRTLNSGGADDESCGCALRHPG